MSSGGESLKLVLFLQLFLFLFQLPLKGATVLDIKSEEILETVTKDVKDIAEWYFRGSRSILVLELIADHNDDQELFSNQFIREFFSGEIISRFALFD